MQLTGREAVVQNIFTDVAQDHVRPASYDLSVGKVFIEGKEQPEVVVIQPQQILIIESNERVAIPVGKVGYAMPKTSLCNEGVLALNTGLVDPGYEGPLSTIAINFSRRPIRLRRGDRFLRVVVHRLEGQEADRRDGTVPSPQDRDEARRSLDYPPTFLDVPGQTDKLIREVSADVVDKQRNSIVLLISAVGFLFVMWNLASFFLLSRQANVLADRALQSEVKAMDFAQVRVTVDSLQARLRAVEGRLPK
jgi:deoxycytidine triphosphate deaminase